MNHRNYRSLISGDKSGPLPAFCRLCLRTLSRFYAAAIRIRNFLYSSGRLKSHRASVPVISVGNITAGGTGKTPLVIWLCDFLLQKNLRPVVLTRGYKVGTNKLSDEPAILAKSCPGAKVLVNPDRVAAAIEAAAVLGADVLIMDDGFQHRRLHRDLDIVTIDATQPFGYGRLLPAGLLREPLTGLSRAHAAIITRSDHVSEYELSQIQGTLTTFNSEISVARAIHQPVCVRSLDLKETGLDQLRGKNIFAFCGIGNPDAFLATIKKLSAVLVGSKIFNDHHKYTDRCLTDIYEEARYLCADLILTTQKDWTKTALLVPTKDILFAYLVVELKVTAGQDRLAALISDAAVARLKKWPTAPPNVAEPNKAVD